MSDVTLKAAALAILAGGASWTQGALARKADGLPCSPFHEDAVKWDMMGALIKAQLESDEPNYASYQLVYNSLRDALPADYKSRDIEAYNDDADVVWGDISDLFA
ncbi:hypothetical protein [Xanthomonas phage BUDD]|nr:hypothetical protein [Xanthomonas phage BUDD]